jgi:hypothetical protein
VPDPAPVVIRAGDDAWSPGGRSEFTYRDLGLAGASAGAIGARHVRRVGAGKIGFDWHCHDADFQFNYVIGGSATVETAHGERHRLSPGDAIIEPGLHRVREFDFSEDYECIQIVVPAEAPAPTVGLGARLPPRVRALDPARRTVVSPGGGTGARAERDGAAGRVWERDLGAGAVSGGRIAIVLAGADARATYASRGCWMLVLDGAVTIAPGAGREPWSPLGPLDAAVLVPGSAATAGPAGVRAIELVLRTAATERIEDDMR